MNLEGKAVLVTGGTKGIGAADSQSSSRTHGADVAILGRYNDDDAKNVKAAITGKGRKCIMIVADMTKPDDAAPEL